MAPFPSRRHSQALPSPSLSESPTYPPPLSKSPPPPSLGSSASSNSSTHNGRKPPVQISTDPIQLYGEVGLPAAGILGGLGRSWEGGKVVRSCLMDNHVNAHVFTNDRGFHNHTSHHVLAAYSLGASPLLLKDIYDLNSLESKPMPPHQPIEISEANWTEHLADDSFYPNYLSFFHRIISTPPAAPSLYAGRPSSVVPVLEKYLFSGEGDMLSRALSGVFHPLIHIGHGLEFGLDALVAEGLAQAACQRPGVAALFDSPWPPAPPKPTSFQSTMSSAFSSLKLSASSSLLGLHPIASTLDSFAATAAKLPREHRIPKEGLSGFTIVDRILHDAAFAPVVGEDVGIEQTINAHGEDIRAWCDEWKFSGEASGEWDEDGRSTKGKGVRSKVPRWEEIVEKCEELVWMATVIYGAASRPGYETVKLDFFTMHCLTSVLFLPTILEQISPRLRPYLLQSHFRVMVSYWISRGRPDLHVLDTLLGGTASPSPPKLPEFSPGAVAKALRVHSPVTPPATDDDEPSTPTADSNGKRKHGSVNVRTVKSVDNRSVVNPWPALLASACDHPDAHLAKVIRSLAFAATHFGHSPPGMYQCSLPGTDRMDGSVFIRAAGLTFRALGYAREGEPCGAWDMSVLGLDSAWEHEVRTAGSESKGKARMTRSATTGSVDEILLNVRADAVVVGADAQEPRAHELSAYIGEERETSREMEERREREEAEADERELMA